MVSVVTQICTFLLKLQDLQSSICVSTLYELLFLDVKWMKSSF